MIVWAIIVGLAAAFLVWLIVPIVTITRFKFDSDKEKAEAEDNYRKTVGQAIGAIAVIATFAWTFFKDSDAMQQAHQQFAAQSEQFKEQQDQTRRQFAAQADQFKEQQIQARRQFANQQFIAAASLLKESSVGPRVAGLYGLKQIAEDQKEYRSPAIYAALGFIKSPASGRPAYNKDGGWPLTQADTQSAIALVAMLDNDHSVKADLDNTYLVRADFSIEPRTSAFEGSSFQGAILYGSNFAGVTLTDSKFNGSYMADWESYGDRWNGLTPDDYANTRMYHVVNFAGARLINAGFDNTSVGGGIFDGACLARAKFWLSNLSRASFKGASLGRTANCEPNGAKAHFFQATLVDTNFDGVDVEGVSFEEAKLIRTRFEKALNVDKAKFGGACVDGAEFPPSFQIALPRCGGP